MIALRMLWYNRVRSLSAAIGISAAFFLCAAQVGVMVGWCRTASTVIRQSKADLWLMAGRTPAFDYGTAIPRQCIYQARSVPGVAWAEGMYMGWMFWQRPDGQMTIIELVGLDEDLAGGPGRMETGTTDCVHAPEGVIVDELYRNALGVRRVGDDVEIGDSRAVVRGFSRDVRTITAAPFVFASLDTAIGYDRRYRPDEVTYVLVRCADGHVPHEVQRDMRAAVPEVEVLTSDEFALRTMRYWMLETGLGITVVLTAGLALAVGGVIVSQTLYTLTTQHSKDFAALLVVGCGRTMLMGTVLLQALVLSGLGMALGSCVYGCAASLSAKTPIPIHTELAPFASVAAAFLAVSLLAAAGSLRAVLRVDPLVLFGG